jgi:hypothetical protein
MLDHPCKVSATHRREIRRPEERRSVKKLAVVVAVLAALMAVYQLGYPSVTIRYRLTLEAELNGQPRTGSGVIQVIYRTNPQILGASAQISMEAQGDAVSVDLGSGGALFALLKKGQHPRSAPEDVIPVLFGVTDVGFGPEVFGRIGALEGRREVPSGLLPLIVRLPNINDPKSTVLFVPPGGQPPNQDLALKRAMIEIVSSGIWPLSLVGITGVPITRGIKKKLPWLEGFTGYTGGQSDPIWSQPEKNLTGSYFTMGAS